jgi:hypothetical protein
VTGGGGAPEASGPGCYAGSVLLRLPARYAWPLAAAPFILVGVGSSALVSGLGDAMVAPLVEAATLMHAKTRANAVEAARKGATPIDEDGLPTGGGVERTALRTAERDHTASVPRQRGGSSARLFIPWDRVMRLTAERLRSVHWAGVRDEHGQPAGVRLSGVGSLGVGLADGDVVTSIDGRPTRTEDEAMEAGAAAWSSGEPALHATIARKDQVVTVTVQLPLRH